MNSKLLFLMNDVGHMSFKGVRECGLSLSLKSLRFVLR